MLLKLILLFFLEIFFLCLLLIFFLFLSLPFFLLFLFLFCLLFLFIYLIINLFCQWINILTLKIFDHFIGVNWHSKVILAIYTTHIFWRVKKLIVILYLGSRTVIIWSQRRIRIMCGLFWALITLLVRQLTFTMLNLFWSRKWMRWEIRQWWSL